MTEVKETWKGRKCFERRRLEVVKLIKTIRLGNDERRIFPFTEKMLWWWPTSSGVEKRKKFLQPDVSYYEFRLLRFLYKCNFKQQAKKSFGKIFMSNTNFYLPLKNISQFWRLKSLRKTFFKWFSMVILFHFKFLTIYL